MNDIAGVFFATVLLTIGLAAYFLVVGALFAGRVARAQRLIDQTQGRSLWIGLVNFLFFAVIAVGLFSLSEKAGVVLRTVLLVPALLITAALAAGLSFGLTGMANLLGERIFPAQAEGAAWKKISWGTILLAFACAVPFAGWFLLLPYIGLTGFGAVILSFLKRENITALSPEPQK